MTTKREVHGCLSPTERDRYWRDGFLFPIRVMDDDAASRARTALEEVVRIRTGETGPEAV